MSTTTYEAKSVQGALEKAAAALGVDAGELEHEVVERKRDFWGGDDETVVIKAWKRAAEAEATQAPPPAPERGAAPHDETAAAAEPEEDADRPEEDDNRPAQAAAEAPGGRAEQRRERAERPPRREAEDEDEAADSDEPDIELAVDEATIAAMLSQIFHDMEFDCSVEVQAEDEGFLATVSGEDKEALLEGNGRCLSALELLVNNAFRNKLPRSYKIRVDAGDFRSRRDQELADLAYQVAHSAKQTGRTQETQPLNPYERRLVHLALAEDAAVTTRSRGSGFLKNVQVIPQETRGGRGGRSRRR